MAKKTSQGGPPATWTLPHDATGATGTLEAANQERRPEIVDRRQTESALETNDVVLDETYCGAHPGSVPGKYVLLAMADDGCGMDQESQAKVFEPFFTTKAQGRGTGLGLATVYGIVKQNLGFIDFSSAPGQGSTFRVYLPVYESVAATDAVPPVAIESMMGGETVLLVEDEAARMNDATVVVDGGMEILV